MHFGSHPLYPTQSLDYYRFQEAPDRIIEMAEVPVKEEPATLYVEGEVNLKQEETAYGLCQDDLAYNSHQNLLFRQESADLCGQDEVYIKEEPTVSCCPDDIVHRNQNVHIKRSPQRLSPIKQESADLCCQDEVYIKEETAESFCQDFIVHSNQIVQIKGESTTNFPIRQESPDLYGQDEVCMKEEPAESFCQDVIVYSNQNVQIKEESITPSNIEICNSEYQNIPIKDENNPNVNVEYQELRCPQLQQPPLVITEVFHSGDNITIKHELTCDMEEEHSKLVESPTKRTHRNNVRQMAEVNRKTYVVRLYKYFR